MNYDVFKKSGEMIVSNISLANDFSSRLVGLMFKSEMPEKYNGLLIKPGYSIHTFFMRFPIDVVFIDKKKKIIKIIRNMKPWRLTKLYFGASETLELRGNSLDKSIQEGEELVFKCIK